jgi:hypothetical protein
MSGSKRWGSRAEHGLENSSNFKARGLKIKVGGRGSGLRGADRESDSWDAGGVEQKAGKEATEINLRQKQGLIG